VAATIVDVALRAGVSTATVSRVLSGSATALPATRDRVLAAAHALDYRPSGVARALKRAETRTIGLVITDIENPFFPQIVRSVEDEAHRLGYGVLLCNAADDPARELATLDLLVERRVDGIILASGRATHRLGERLAQLPMPVVLVNAVVPTPGLAGIGTAHRAGARMAAEHLLDLGHRRIAFVGAPPDHAASGLRRRGVLDALRAAGLVPGALVTADGDGRVDGGASAMVGLLDRADAPTGVVAYNDLTAIGVLRAVRAAGGNVPRDCSVVGFDDIEAASWTDPPLTTIRQPTAEMGRWAVERLASALRGAAGAPERASLEPELVVRGSTAPPPGEPAQEALPREP
jgi:LacI family transcriptional regulator